MINPDSKLQVNASIADLSVDFNVFEDTVFERLSDKMEEKDQFFHFDQKILVSAFCAYVRSSYLSGGVRDKDLSVFARLYQLLECDRSAYIQTGVFLMSVIRDLLEAEDVDGLIQAWGDIFIHVYMQVSACQAPSVLME